MNFRHIDPFDNQIIPLNNSPANAGTGYGDFFSDRDLLLISRHELIGDGDNPTLEQLAVSAGEAAGRSIFQKAALYHGSKASRKILGPPTPQWASWAATPQARRESLQLIARPAEKPDARYIGQLVPPSIQLDLVETGSDCVFAGSWQGHSDTRYPFSSPQITAPPASVAIDEAERSTATTITTSGYAWVIVAAHFSPDIVRDAASLQLRHNWRNAAIFQVGLVVLYKENPVLVSQSPIKSTIGQAGVLFMGFKLRLPTSIDSLRQLPEIGLFSPDAVADSRVQRESNWLAYTSYYDLPAGGTSTGAGSGSGAPMQAYQKSWSREPFFYWYPGQSFYIAPN